MRRTLFFTLLFTATGCASASLERQAQTEVKAYIDAQLEELRLASLALRDAAPAPDADGWSYASDRAKVDAMRAAWKRARNAYERIEGAIAVLFSGLDYSTDARYDMALEDGLETATSSLFDDRGVTGEQGFTGMHAIERALWANEVPAAVTAFESPLPGYQPARTPQTEAEARAFKEQLCALLVRDVETMQREFRPLALDNATAFRGVIGSMEEQAEKIRLAATGTDESRYAQHTLADMRANLAGGRAVFDAFVPWLRTAQGLTPIDQEITAAFGRVQAAYDAIPGDAIPPPPDGWNPSAPTPAHLDTPYGRLFTLVQREADPNIPETLVADMGEAADALAIPQLPQ